MAIPSRNIRLLIADDNEPLRYTFRTILKNYPNIEIVGEASDGEDAVLRVGELQPTVALIDINMPRLDGIAATRRIKSNWPQVAVVGLSIHGDTYLTNVMLKAGAAEVVSKEKATEELYGAIKRAVALSLPESSKAST